MINEIFSVLGDILEGVTNAFVTVFTNIASVFYDSVEEKLTIVGILALIGFGVALARWGFNLILRLLKMGQK